MADDDELAGIAAYRDRCSLAPTALLERTYVRWLKLKDSPQFGSLDQSIQDAISAQAQALKDELDIREPAA